MWFAGGCAQKMNIPESSILQIFAQKSVCWLRRSFHARKIVLSLKSSHELRERRLPSQMWAVDLISTRTHLSSCAHCFLHCLLLLLGIPGAPGALGQTLFSYRAGSVWWTCGKRVQEELCAVCPSIPEMAGHLFVTWSNSLEIMII